MQKKFILVLILIFSAGSFCFAQDKMEKYCEVTIREEFFKVSLNPGTVVSLDSAEANQLHAVEKLKNTVDVLDQMSKLGWQLVSSLCVPHNTKKVYYFKKQMDRSLSSANLHSN